MTNTIIIDNYDSFTYNLVHIVNDILNTEVVVMRNDVVNYKMLDECSHIILSPGPGIPDEAGDLKKVIKEYADKKVILGVCLGHQAIGEVFGASLYNLPNVFHGRRTIMHKTGIETPIFQNMPKEFYAGRYHSWAISKESNTSAFNITALDEYGEIMAIEHKLYKVYGVQFHPESIMTDEGRIILDNFLKIKN